MSDDEATSRRLADPNIVISMRPDQPGRGRPARLEGLLRVSAAWLEAWDAHTFEAARLWDAEDFVFVGTRESGRGKISGVPIENESTFVFTWSQGKVVRLQIFGSEREAFEAVGLAGTQDSN